MDQSGSERWQERAGGSICLVAFERFLVDCTVENHSLQYKPFIDSIRSTPKSNKGTKPLHIMSYHDSKYVFDGYIHHHNGLKILKLRMCFSI